MSLFVSGPAQAAGPTTNADLTSTSAALSQVLEERARQVLLRYLKEREFEVNVTVTASKRLPPRAAYDPRKLTNGVFSTMSSEELNGYVKFVKVETLLASRLDGSRKQIEELLLKNLKLDRRRGDKVTFGRLGIASDSDEWTKERSDLKQQMANLTSENSRLNRELEVAKTALATEIAKAAEATAAAQKAAQAPATPPAPVDHFWQDVWKQNSRLVTLGAAAIVLVFLLASIALVLMGRSLASAGKNLGGAIGSIAQAMENVGGTLVNNVNLPAGADGTRRIEAIESRSSSGQRSLPSGSIDSIHSHVLKVRQEILDNLNDSTEAIILRHLTQLCAHEVSVPRAVVTMELLGRDVSTELFKRLGVATQDAMLKFLREGNYERSKVELMMEAGEELKTKLLVDSFDKARGRPSEKVAERILQLGDEELAQVALELSPDSMPRFFLYLDPQKIAVLLAHVRKTDPKRYELAVGSLTKMADAETVEGMDEEILHSLEAMIDRTRADAQRPFLKVYQQIVEASGDELGEEILQQLSSDPRLDSFFRQNVITLHTFFLLSEDLRTEIVESLSNKDVAGLLFGIKEEERESVLKSVAERRRNLVTEELESLTARGGRQGGYAFKRVKDIVVRKIRDLKAEGTITEALKGARAAPAKDPSPETASADPEAKKAVNE